MTPKEYAELLEYIYNNHGWSAKFYKNKLNSKMVKYIDSSFDTRTGDIWKVSLRIASHEKEFKGESLKEKIINWLETEGFSFE